MNTSLVRTTELLESYPETLTESLTDSMTESSNHSSGGILTDEELEYWLKALSNSRHTVQRILVPIVLIIGAFGNSITIAVLTRRHMQTSTNLYLTALAISDILYLIFMFSLSLKHTPGMSHKDYLGYWHYYRYGLWLTDASRNDVFCTQSRAKKIIIAVYLLCFLLTITTPHEWDGFYWFTAVTFIVLPLILLAAFNTFLILAVKRSRKQRTVMTGLQRDNQSHSTQENKITVMLIAVVLLALVCQLPTAAMLIYTSFHQYKNDCEESGKETGAGREDVNKEIFRMEEHEIRAGWGVINIDYYNNR
ncbi:hypothetical protein Anas_09355 [Armadillidium nasatum]|uniref:G-protein coupled receptors family 1 profile domain-containing protein n=1 Tax=Armadillidium nasatum TaxID=96803 RepID=A0A5N5ST98_9CRUS|nr:hypothetical protein Anas_09355 [Armadillidium nasatum]